MKSWMVIVCLMMIAAAYENAGGAGVMETPFQDTLEITGTVRFLSEEGGFYGIVGDDGQRYDPLNLASSFAVEGLRVKVRAHIEKGVVTIRLWGRVIRILTIDKLE